MNTTHSNWGNAVQMWTTYLRAAGRAESTIGLREFYVRRFGRAIKTDPFGVTMDQVVVWLANEDWGQETRKSARASLCSFYGWAVDSGRIEQLRNPTRSLPSINAERALPRPAPDSVLGIALAKADDKQRLMLMLAAYAGLRRCEISLVHPADFDWEQGPYGELLVHGKGSRERIVPVHPDLRVAVLAELARRRAGNVGTGFRLYALDATENSYLFPGKRGHVTADNVGKILERLLAGKWTAHTLRHRFATKAYEPERDLRAVQELLGHSKPETTARYVKTPPGARRKAVLNASVQAA